MTGLPGCDAAYKDDRTLAGLMCGSEKFTELCYVGFSAFSVLTLLAGRQEGHPAVKN